ncbi:Acyl-CoA dehydrogenase/oxidase N-terminal domain-containing protein [Caenorhabditis elegans]|uniref:Acyl-CoA dehydrogenase/oxidase N-terminal domain-containing protein n=1 Tax=Caenorhabditis elegans TaxID=6239 RepID=Q9BIB0_CAEEL|nr:Acyl-CoA dehydrogenase/oxidase N-terminal domain-containing protein [Caenorhabditis elegans]CCD64844.2 Acyl-CoA dehydrogenase/oxidase N-terminal domain-containing protein [Caenorhabditis elegans]|eukprot:NP_001343622.1 Acyl CoA DeHydrogenase [Caenorhabditis elegans]
MFKVPRKLPISAISTFSTTGSISAQQQPRVFPLQHLNENEKKLVEKVKNFAQSSVKPLVREMDRDARINKQLLKKAFDLKLMGLKIDPKLAPSHFRKLYLDPMHSQCKQSPKKMETTSFSTDQNGESVMHRLLIFSLFLQMRILRKDTEVSLVSLWIEIMKESFLGNKMIILECVQEPLLKCI